jgi:hypothetical protein
MTGFRLFIGLITLAVGAILMINVLEKFRHYAFMMDWMMSSFWLLAFGLDINAVWNGNESCNNNLKDVYGGDCDNSVYGLSIAIDLCFLIMIGVAHYFHFMEFNEAVAHGGGLTKSSESGYVGSHV